MDGGWKSLMPRAWIGRRGVGRVDQEVNAACTFEEFECDIVGGGTFTPLSSGSCPLPTLEQCESITSGVGWARKVYFRRRRRWRPQRRCGKAEYIEVHRLGQCKCNIEPNTSVDCSMWAACAADAERCRGSNCGSEPLSGGGG